MTEKLVASWFPPANNPRDDARGRATIVVAQHSTLLPSLLRRRGLPLSLAELELDGRAELVNLDEPVVLRREGLRPSRVATRQRSTTQPQARLLHERHPSAAGLKWWSMSKALWTNVTVFDRAARHLRVVSVRPLHTDDPVVVEAATFSAFARCRKRVTILG